MLKATHILSNLEKHQMQLILNQYTNSDSSIEERLKAVEEDKDYEMEPYYLYYQDGRVTGFVLIDFVAGELLQAKIYMEQEQQMDLLLRQLKSYLRQSKVKMALFFMEEELDLEIVNSLSLSTCEYRMECLHSDYSSWVQTRKASKSRLRFMTKEDEKFYKKALESIFYMDSWEQEERLLSMTFAKKQQEDSSTEFMEEDHMVGLILESNQGEPIGIAGTYIGKNFISLFDLAVLEGHQGKGYGSDLMCHIFEQTKRLNKNYLLSVHSDNEIAVALYQAIGFAIKEQLYCYQLEL